MHAKIKYQFPIAPMHMAISPQFTISLLIPTSPTYSLHNCDFSHQENWVLHVVSSHICTKDLCLLLSV